MSALSPTTRVVLDAMCDGNAQTLAVMRHACIEVREVVDSLQSRLAAAEAEAERAMKLLRDADAEWSSMDSKWDSMEAVRHHATAVGYIHNDVKELLASRPEGEVRDGR